MATFVNTVELLMMVKKHNHADHVLTDKRRHSNIVDVLSFRGGDGNNDHYLVVAKIRRRLSVSKRPAQSLILKPKKSIRLKSPAGLHLWKT
jgi:hypothetical protein